MAFCIFSATCLLHATSSLFYRCSMSSLQEAFTLIRTGHLDRMTTQYTKNRGPILRRFDQHGSPGFRLDDARRGDFSALTERDDRSFDDFGLNSAREVNIHIPLRGYGVYMRRFSQGGMVHLNVQQMLLRIVGIAQDMIEEYQHKPCAERDFQVGGPGHIQLRHVLLQNVYKIDDANFGITLLVSSTVYANVLGVTYQ